MNIKWLCIIAGALLLIILLLNNAGLLFNPQAKSKGDAFNKTQTEDSNKFDTPRALIHLSKIVVGIGKNTITIGEFMNSYSSRPFTLNKKDYPELFGGEYIDAGELNDAVHNKYFVIVSSNSSRGGSYQPYYFIIVDPLTDSVVYKSPKEFNTAYDQNYEVIDNSAISLYMMVYNLYDDCSNCRLSLSEYIAYDPKVSKFVSVNQRYKSDFIKKLKYYTDLENSQKCIYKGEELTISEIYKRYGDSARCNDALSRSNEPLFMTMGEFSILKKNTQQIINGERQSLIEYDE